MDLMVEKYADRKLQTIKDNLDNTSQLDRIELKLEVLIRSIGKIEYHMGLGIENIIDTVGTESEY